MVMPHEMIDCFSAAGWRLCPALEAMLGEDPCHQTERRGSGFTQATRFLAARINQPRFPASPGHLDLFSRRPDPVDPGIAREQLSAIIAGLDREESRLLATIIRDLVLPQPGRPAMATYLPVWPERMKVGSCPMAEKWFLELAHGFIPRTARCNVIVDDTGKPLLVEKIGMGDDHSCLSLRPLVMNGATLPVGSLLAVQYEACDLANAPANITLPGQTIALEACQGFRMLRLTTLAVSGANRRRAFSTHFDAQVAEGLFEPASTDINQLLQLAEDAKASAQPSLPGMFLKQKTHHMR